MTFSFWVREPLIRIYIGSSITVVNWIDPGHQLINIKNGLNNCRQGSGPTTTRPTTINIESISWSESLVNAEAELFSPQPSSFLWFDWNCRHLVWQWRRFDWKYHIIHRKSSFFLDRMMIDDWEFSFPENSTRKWRTISFLYNLLIYWMLEYN